MCPPNLRHLALTSIRPLALLIPAQLHLAPQPILYAEPPPLRSLEFSAHAA